MKSILKAVYLRANYEIYGALLDEIMHNSIGVLWMEVKGHSKYNKRTQCWTGQGLSDFRYAANRLIELGEAKLVRGERGYRTFTIKAVDK